MVFNFFFIILQDFYSEVQSHDTTLFSAYLKHVWYEFLLSTIIIAWSSTIIDIIIGPIAQNIQLTPFPPFQCCSCGEQFQ